MSLACDNDTSFPLKIAKGEGVRVVLQAALSLTQTVGLYFLLQITCGKCDQWIESKGSIY